MTTVVFYGMRHGEEEGDTLTPKGEEQVINSARAHLLGVKFTEAFCSGMQRAFQSAKLALKAIGQEATLVFDEPGFGYVWLCEDPNMPEIGPPPNFPVINDYFGIWHAPTYAMRGRVMQTLLERAKDLALSHDGETVNVLVASHSPCIEAAVPDPREFPRLQEADIVRYTVVVEDGIPRITDALYLPAPR